MGPGQLNIDLTNEQINALLPAIAARQLVLSKELASLYDFYRKMPQTATQLMTPVADEIRALHKVKRMLENAVRTA